MLDKVKLFIGLKDTSQDDLLSLIIQNTEATLMVLLGKPVPVELEFIVVEVSVSRYNKIGSEGLKGQSVDSVRFDFEPDLFSQYEKLLEPFKSTELQKKKGSVRFL